MDTVTPSPKTPLRDRLATARAQASGLRRQARQTMSKNGGRHRLTLLLAYAIAMVVAIGFYVVASGVYTLACLWIAPETVSPILLSKLADLLFALLCLFLLLPLLPSPVESAQEGKCPVFQRLQTGQARKD